MRTTNRNKSLAFASNCLIFLVLIYFDLTLAPTCICLDLQMDGEDTNQREITE